MRELSRFPRLMLVFQLAIKVKMLRANVSELESFIATDSDLTVRSLALHIIYFAFHHVFQREAEYAEDAAATLAAIAHRRMALVAKGFKLRGDGEAQLFVGQGRAVSVACPSCKQTTHLPPDVATMVCTKCKELVAAVLV